jgi:hypothetical protein
MPRAAARITQADIARAVRAVAQCGVAATIEVTRDGTLRVIVNDEQAKPVERKREIVL